MLIKLRHVVYSHRKGLRWYFIDTQRPEKKVTYKWCEHAFPLLHRYAANNHKAAEPALHSPCLRHRGNHPPGFVCLLCNL